MQGVGAIFASELLEQSGFNTTKAESLERGPHWLKEPGLPKKMSLTIESLPESDMNSLCRVCGSVATEALVAIFGSNGIEELGDKISKYLPIKICPDDVLPTQICAPCANTVLSWDLLYHRCLSADKKFTMLLSEEKLTEECYVEYMFDEDAADFVVKDEKIAGNESLEETCSESLHCIDLIDSPKKRPECSDNEYNFGDNMFIETDSEREDLFNDETTVDTAEESKKYDNEGVVKKRSCKHDVLFCHSCNMDLPNETEAIDFHLTSTKSSCNVNCKTCKFDATIKVIDRTCQICDERLANKAELRKHISEHEVISCNECLKIFKSYVTLLSHKNIHNESKPCFSCQICGWLTKRKFNLQLHISSHIYDNFCKLCCASFNDQQKLEKHKATHSEEELEHYTESDTLVQCENCNLVFNSRLKLYEHFMIMHECKEKKFICQCGRIFETETVLRIHENVNHKSTFTCSICHKSFNRYKNYKEHKNSHSDNRPFSCDICGKSFKYSSNLAQHKSAHKGVKSYKCSECNRCFLRSNTLANHIKIHKNERNFRCTFCPLDFIQSSSLQKHIRTIHRTCEICGKMVGDKREYQIHVWKECDKLHISKSSNS